MYLRESTHVVGDREHCAPRWVPSSLDGSTTINPRTRPQGYRTRQSCGPKDQHAQRITSQSGRRVQNGNPGTPIQSVCIKYRPIWVLNLLPRIFKLYYRLLGACLIHYTAPAVQKQGIHKLGCHWCTRCSTPRVCCTLCRH